ncbi:MAG TPA: carbamate kinase [Candidatus Atribacteria bacterium]|nr:carbamate kinase [Candidatus Atribacteria bacterium]
MTGKRIVVALGGNAILRPGQKGTYKEQLENVKNTTLQIANMVKEGYEVVITHGNGPQVGAVLLQNEGGEKLYNVPSMPMDVCGAETQGFIGYMIQQSLLNEFIKNDIKKSVTTVVTQVLVSKDDPAFSNPTKPVGPFYSKEEAEKRQKEKPDEVWIEDSGRGYRRVVPSPDPKAIIEKDVVNCLISNGNIVIASGGGGIPVIKEDDGTYRGVEAVIDKDLAGEKLAQEVDADILLILTDVPNVYINYRKENEKALGEIKASEMEKYQKEGHFKAGSMGPKVKAALRFVKNGGKMAIITALEKAVDALEGKAGTRILP